MADNKEGSSLLLCMICCTNYKQDRKYKSKGGLGTLIRFKQFCKELECCLAEKKMRKNRNKDLKRRLAGHLNLAYGDLSICPDCLNLICSAMEIKNKAKDLEEQVLNLQTQVLEVMEEMDGRMGTFLTRMKKIESVVKESDEQRLQTYLEENVTDELRGDAVQFRERIIEAVEDLRIYRKELTDKVHCDNLIKRKKKRLEAERLKKLVDQKTQTNISGEIESKKVNKSSILKSRCFIVKNATQQTDPIYILENGDETSFENSAAVKVEVDPQDYCMEYDDDACNFDEGDSQNFSEHYEMTKVENDLPNPEKRNTIKSGRPKRAAAIKRKRPSPPPSLSSNGSASEDDESDDDDDDNDAGSNFSEDDYEMQMAKCPKRKRVLFENLDVSQMSNFKKNIVSAVLKRIEDRMDSEGNIQQRNDHEASGDIDSNLPLTSEDPRDRYLAQYNAETGKLWLENIEIICNEEAKSLECSLCTYSVKESDRSKHLFYRMHDHMLGKHLDAYRCGTCSAVLSTIVTYREHVAGHKEPTLCDICGKPFRNKESLRTHKWLHMSEDEKADAIQRGMTDPRERQKMAPRNVPCSTCGKMFRNKGEVRIHERIHGERERIPCPSCGKMLLNEINSLGYHEKYTCPVGGQKPEKTACPICHKLYKTTAIMKRHMKIEHPSTPLEPIYCELCGRQFKSKGNLKKHLRETHSEERPFSCKKCGAGFKVKQNLTRHEQTCRNGASETVSGGAHGHTHQRQPPPEQQTSGNYHQADVTARVEEQQGSGYYVHYNNFSSIASIASASHHHSLETFQSGINNN